MLNYFDYTSSVAKYSIAAVNLITGHKPKHHWRSVCTFCFGTCLLELYTCKQPERKKNIKPTSLIVHDYASAPNLTKAHNHHRRQSNSCNVYGDYSLKLVCGELTLTMCGRHTLEYENTTQLSKYLLQCPLRIIVKSKLE